MLQSSSFPRKPMPPAPSDAVPQVFIVDDDPSVRESFDALIRSAGWHAKTFASAHDFLSYANVDAPCCVLLDVGLPGMTGLDVQAAVTGDRVALPIVFVTGCGDVPTAVQAMKCGAVDYLTKPVSADKLFAAVGRAIETSRHQLAQDAELTQLRTRHKSLTPREAQVMALVVTGRLNKVIASDLAICEITVKVHRGSVMRKMQARSLADLVRMAAKLGVA